MYLLENKDLKEKIDGLETEYLLTNGLGGYASNTLNEMPMRKYHGILVAALNPPVERFMSLVRTLDTIESKTQSYQLFSSKYEENKVRETDCLKSFEKEAGVHWIYSQEGVFALKKSLYLINGKNQAILKYEIESGKEAIHFQLRPEFSIRDHHEVLSQDSAPPESLMEDLCLHLTSHYSGKAHSPDQTLNYSKQIHTSFELVQAQESTTALMETNPNQWQVSKLNQWSAPYYLSNEVERGLETYTCHFQPASYQIEIEANSRKTFYAVLKVDEGKPEKNQSSDLSNESPEALIQREIERYQFLLASGQDRRDCLPHALKKAHETLSIAANDFIVRRQSTGKHTILAGYPWFTDWGRDSMISLSGLTLSTGRPHLFREIYETFERYMKSGILPNMFPDDGEAPLYNTVDATLWMPIAMNRYYEETQDEAYVKAHFVKTLRELISEYQKGTLNNTYMDEDGLIWSGDESTQLTWMDVKVNGWVVTPRHGKAVEINALWYNALMIGAQFEEDPQLKEGYLALADKVKANFNQSFWNSSKNYLNDVVRGDEVIDLLRPNQLIAISLPYPLLDLEKTEQVLQQVSEHLYFDKGIRSLAPHEPDYQGYYGGNVLSRDGAYHRGTGWGWLLGPYMDAVDQLAMRKGEEMERRTASLVGILNQAIPHLNELCLGQYAENFDGDPPHHGRGCMAQAWSVAEIVRWIDQVNQRMKGSKADE